MTSTFSPGYPADYYYPEFVDNRPIESNQVPPSLSKAITTNDDRQLLTKRKTTSPNNIASDIATNQGLPEVDITQAVKVDPKKNLIRDPVEKNIPKLIVDNSIIKQAARTQVIPVTNLDDVKTIESRPTGNGYATTDWSNRPLPSAGPLPSARPRRKSSQRSVKFADDVRPGDDYWKKDIRVDDQGVVIVEPIIHDEKTYQGPFGLSRSSTLIYYLVFTALTILGAAFLIVTGVFYSQNYPDSSSTTGLLVGMGVCAFVFYLSLQLVLIGIWHQKRLYENPVKKVTRKSIAPDESADYLKNSMEQEEAYDYSYQQPSDYGPYGYYSYPPYVSNVNEQATLQQPDGTTGGGYYDGVVWPTNVQVETQPDPKFYQPMEWSIGPVQQATKVNESARSGMQTPLSSIIKKSARIPNKPVEAEPTVGDFDSIQFNSTVIEQPLPVLSKAPETNELIQSLAKIEPTKNTTSNNSEIGTATSSKVGTAKSSKVGTAKSSKVEPATSATDASSSDSEGKSHKHPRRHRRHHHHHHHHRHHHRRYSYSPCPECEYYSRMSRRPPSPPVYVPRKLTPRFPRILTPKVPKNGATVYRETAVNTGNETKIVRDSSTTANIEDVPNKSENRLSQIPVVRRTVIVEPYPSQPSSQIIVKPQENLIGKISLSKNPIIHSENERIVYPSTNFLGKISKQKKKKKKKKSTVINNNIIEDLELEDIDGDGDDEGFDFNLKTKNSQISTRRTIKNAFYN